MKLNTQNETTLEKIQKMRISVEAMTRMRHSTKLEKTDHQMRIEFQEMVALEELEDISVAIKVLKENKRNYIEKRGRKWIVTLVGVLIGITLALTVPAIWSKLSNSLYDRDSIEAVLSELAGDSKVSEATTHEIMLVSYNFNTQQPHLYSKYYAKINPGYMDVTMAKAAGGTSAAPIYFEPQNIMDRYGIPNLIIDGGIIANNPAIYCYLLAHDLYEKQKIRILSLSTGTDLDYKADLKKFNGISYLKVFFEFLNNIDIFFTDEMLKKGQAKQLEVDGDKDIMNYLRVEGSDGGVSLSAIDENSIDKLKKLGKDEWVKSEA